jgi:hypothetical protein
MASFPGLLGGGEVHCHPWRQAIRPIDSPGQRETGRAERQRLNSLWVMELCWDICHISVELY